MNTARPDTGAPDTEEESDATSKAVTICTKEM